MTTSPASVLELVARAYNVRVGDLINSGRKQPLAFVRQTAMWLVRKSLGLTVVEIGGMFHRDHGTVCYATALIDGLRAHNAAVREQTDLLCRILSAGEAEPSVPVFNSPFRSHKVIKEPVRPNRQHAYCACGNIAGKKKQNSWVCDRCDAIEHHYYSFMK